MANVMSPRERRFSAAAILLAALSLPAPAQRRSDLITPTPLPEGHCLVLGFLGGRERWDAEQSSARTLALKLRGMNLPGVHVETFENRRRRLALGFIRDALDRNGDGLLYERERAAACILLYGQSFGGAAVVKLARELQQREIPVRLTVQVDSVGLGDGLIPSNVAAAANIYQDDGLIIQGEPEITAENPARTQILGNFRFTYGEKNVDLSLIPWWKKFFRVAHTKVEQDPEVWAKVEALILQALPDPTSARSGP